MPNLSYLHGRHTPTSDRVNRRQEARNDMDDRTRVVPPVVTSTAPMTRPAGVSSIARARRRRFPTVYYLRQHARRRIPKFGFDATDGGAGNDGGIVRNAAALDAIELVPRYGVDDGSCHMEVELFGRRYSAPFGVAPMGMPGIVWPGAEKYLAKAAQRARIPYTAGTVASSTVEELAALAGDMLWFQLYRIPQEDHRYGFDLVKRAQAAGAHVLAITMDVPLRTKRPREVRRGLVLPFRLDAPTVWDVISHPAWLVAYREHGLPRFANYARYVENPTSDRLAAFSQRSDQVGGGAFSWDEVKRYSDLWRGPVVLRGVMHQQDEANAVSIGIAGH